MSELIERKEALEAIKKYGKDAISAGRRTIDPVDDIVELCNMLTALPAVDAAPVVHGRWKGANRNMYGAISGQCSICGLFSGLWMRNMPYKYCPYCGAKLEENAK